MRRRECASLYHPLVGHSRPSDGREKPVVVLLSSVIKSYDLHLHWVSFIDAEQLIFVNQSGCDKKAGQTQMGWSPLGLSRSKLIS
ncbi:uncharacterized protein B0I36DRAFT_411626 [Microdochium trichocladiopsis]|uniref:Uncharacterized protein n=1 Tax=Microdochium trichocladiopsis TaxID=1682393 RepID=A0A9P9BPU6_9PEZI|nr:uncharacterized protein B0I36DRAFT_411626 [Microdochium trichocladiopsis]KAH7029607.1 hypothetical protein B0I36DRAFT_411626 [Microdochium trichocladiopsis]